MEKKYIKLDKEALFDSIKTTFLIIFLWLIIMILIKLFIPITLNTVQQLISIVTIWINSTDIYIKFFGGIFMLLVSFKILMVLLQGALIMFEETIKELGKIINKYFNNQKGGLNNGRKIKISKNRRKIRST